MCFSASASFIAGAGLSAAGVVTLQQTKKRAEVPFALIPLLFGVQQASEGVLWLSFLYRWPQVQTFTTYFFTAFSHVLWPAFVPFAVLMLERDRKRRKVMYGLWGAGLAVALFHLYYMIAYPLTAEVTCNSIVYHMPRRFLPLVLLCYFASTCGAPLASSHRLVRWFGAAALGFAALAYMFYEVSFVSVWCFFAAALSIMIYWFYASRNRSRST